MSKSAQVAFPVHELIAERWSPRAFSERTLDPQTIGSLLEAARWAPSCFNEQPWRFLVASKDDSAGFARMAAALMDGNAWAKAAPLLILSVARTNFERNDVPNKHAWHDVGLAVENLVLQAQALGLATHQMAGFDATSARDALRIPDGYEPVAMIAVGYPGDANALPAPLAEREGAARQRRPLETIAFGAGWQDELALGG